MILRFTVDLPPRECSPNGRFDRHEKAAAVADYRHLAYVHATNARVKSNLEWPNEWICPTLARVSLKFGLKDQNLADASRYHPRDADNALASCKALIDGMVDAKCLASDRWANMEIGSITADPKLAAGVYVTVTAVE